MRRNALLICLVVAMGVVASALEPDARTILLLHFDDSLVGVAGETPTAASGVSFETGVRNNGAFFSPSNQVFFTGTNNINATNGTLEFWIKPRWSGNDGAGHFALKFGDGGGMLFGKDGANNWRCIFNRFGAGGRPERGIAVNVSSEWRSNEWHHAAFTWSAQSLKLYVDGSLRSETVLPDGLPNVSSTIFQIGADGMSSSLNAVLDELRLSDVERTAQEIQQSFLADLVVTNLAVQPTTTNLLQTWWLTPTLTATTSIGVVQIPSAAVAWTSSNTNIAYADAVGRIVANSPGVATLTATLNGAAATLTLTVVPPVRAPQVESIDPYLSVPAAGYVQEMPVVVINFMPTQDGTNIDSSVVGMSSTIASFKTRLTDFNKRIKFMLEEGSRFHGYKNSNAPPALGYRIVQVVTAYEIMPPGRDAGGGNHFPDYNQILARFGAENFVRNQNVREFWIWGYHNAGIVPVESNMSSPTTGDISNSSRFNDDLPIFDRTYVLYNYNATRTQAEAVHNHGHQLESILSYVAQRQDGNSDLFWKKFCGQNTNGTFQQGRCGNTHFPPNATNDYDYLNPTLVESDCEDWTPDRLGPTRLVNAATWGDLPYAWPGDPNPPQKTESQYYIYWMQNMPGHQNGVRYGTNVMINWWRFTADWDNAIRGGLGLYKNPEARLLPAGFVSDYSRFALLLAGDAGVGYELQRSDNLASWQSLFTSTNFPGSLAVTDSPPSGLSTRYYRFRRLP